MEKHNFVTIADLTKEKILYMIEMAEEFEKHPNRELLKGKVVATLFFERYEGRDPEGHYPYGIQLCRRDSDAPSYRGSSRLRL